MEELRLVDLRDNCCLQGINAMTQSRDKSKLWLRYSDLRVGACSPRGESQGSLREEILLLENATLIKVDPGRAEAFMGQVTSRERNLDLPDCLPGESFGVNPGD